jgi:hypothetical protein
MSYDFRTGILPTGALAYVKAQLQSIPFPISIDHTSTDVNEALASTGSNRRFWAQGKGNIKAVPDSIVALVYAATWDFDVSLSGVGGAMTWSGTLKRGVDYRSGVETGLQLFTQREAFSLGIYPPDPDAKYKVGNFIWEYSDTESETETFFRIDLDPRSLLYVAADDSWILGSGFFAGTTNGSDTTTVGSSGTGTETSGLTICGETWKLSGEEVGSFGGSITPATWLA